MVNVWSTMCQLTMVINQFYSSLNEWQSIIHVLIFFCKSASQLYLAILDKWKSWFTLFLKNKQTFSKKSKCASTAICSFWLFYSYFPLWEALKYWSGLAAVGRERACPPRLSHPFLVYHTTTKQVLVYYSFSRLLLFSVSLY